MDKSDRYTEAAAIEKLRYALTVQRVNEELIEQLGSSIRWLLHYAKKYNIPLPEQDKIQLLIDRTLEITNKIPDESYHSDKDDDDSRRVNRTILGVLFNQRVTE